MAHFAKLDSTNNVIGVDVVVNEVITDGDGVEQEQLGINFLTNLYGGGWYRQTSYNGTFRKNFASIGSIYDGVRDAFYIKQPYPSWTFNESTCIWEAPVAMPDDSKLEVDPKNYNWNEATTNWVEIE